MGVALATGMFIVIMGIFFLIALAASVLTIIGRWKVFEKAGKPGWAAIVPYYNTYVTYELGNFPPMLVFLTVGTTVIAFVTGFIEGAAGYNEVLLVPALILSILLSMLSLAISVIEVLVSINIAKKFGKSALYGLGIAFLPYVFYMMLGFDKTAVYTEEKTV